MLLRTFSYIELTLKDEYPTNIFPPSGETDSLAIEVLRENYKIYKDKTPDFF